MHVEPEPYGEAELQAAQNGVIAALQAANLGVGVGVGFGLCRLSDAVRVEVTLYNGSGRTPELIARVQELLAPFGDLVRLEVSEDGRPQAVSALPPATPPPVQVPGRAASVSRYVAMPTARRCVRGDVVHVAVRSGADVRGVTVTAAGRRRALPPATGAKLAVRLDRRHTTVAVTVALRDGRSATRSITLRRCG